MRTRIMNYKITLKNGFEFEHTAFFNTPIEDVADNIAETYESEVDMIEELT